MNNNIVMIKRMIVGELRKLSSILRNILTPKKSLLPGFLEKKRIEYQPRKVVFSSSLLEKEILISDSYWYLPTLDEIWRKQIYKFQAYSEAPFIIDCGANIGLSVIYWKHLYPKANIIAFEPDAIIFELLRKNVEEFGLENVDLRPYAVWSSNTQLRFKSDNSVGGKLVKNSTDSKMFYVNTYRLRDLLNQHVDMLKIDIEGAEYEVLMDCTEKLINVDHIFVEYHGEANEKLKLHNILEMLQKVGFRYHIKEANPVNHPFIQSERNKLYDLQLNIFAFRNNQL